MKTLCGTCKHPSCEPYDNLHYGYHYQLESGFMKLYRNGTMVASTTFEEPTREYTAWRQTLDRRTGLLTTVLAYLRDGSRPGIITDVALSFQETIEVQRAKTGSL